MAEMLNARSVACPHAQRSEYPNLTRRLVEWVVAAPAGTELPLTAWTPRAGTVRTTITLD